MRGADREVKLEVGARRDLDDAVDAVRGGVANPLRGVVRAVVHHGVGAGLRDKRPSPHC
jgi:hypothetical protein